MQEKISELVSSDFRCILFGNGAKKLKKYVKFHLLPPNEFTLILFKVYSSFLSISPTDHRVMCVCVCAGAAGGRPAGSVSQESGGA